MATRSSATTEHFSKIIQDLTFIILLKNGAAIFIDKDHWPSNSPDLNPLDYSIWDELAEGMDWTQISTKQDLIDELRQAPKKVRQTVVFESCNTWTVRLWRISKNDGNHL